MVSSNGARSIDPLRTIVGQTNPRNLSNNSLHFNELLINGVIPVIGQEIVQNPCPLTISNNMNSFSNKNDTNFDYSKHIVHATAIDDFIARSEEKLQPMDPWLHFHVAAAQSQRQYHIAAAGSVFGCRSYSGADAGAKNEEISSGSMGEVVVGCYNDNNNSEENRVTMKNSGVFPTDSDMSAAEKRRRRSEELREKSLVRKQKRMIKNRESAARSRARKQAYTNNLEQKVRQLKEMNAWLKLKKSMETRILSSSSDPMQKTQLRRTNSATF